MKDPGIGPKPMDVVIHVLVLGAIVITPLVVFQEHIPCGIPGIIIGLVAGCICVLGGDLIALYIYMRRLNRWYTTILKK